MNKVQVFFLIPAFVLIMNCHKKSNKSSSIAIDETQPTITLKGNAEMYIDLGSSLADPGANAIDDVDGDLSAFIISDWNSSVDNSTLGSYKVSYSVKDHAGNTTLAYRKVNVKLSIAAGTFTIQ